MRTTFCNDSCRSETIAIKRLSRRRGQQEQGGATLDFTDYHSTRDRALQTGTSYRKVLRLKQCKLGGVSLKRGVIRQYLSAQRSGRRISLVQASLCRWVRACGTPILLPFPCCLFPRLRHAENEDDFVRVAAVCIFGARSEANRTNALERDGLPYYLILPEFHCIVLDKEIAKMYNSFLRLPPECF
jgi:hypothetical protein